jgi:hypothetical protein
MNDDVRQELEELLLQHGDSGLAEPERARVNAILTEHPEARRVFTCEQMLDATLHLERASGLDGVMGITSDPLPHPRQTTRRYRREHLGIAALIMLSLGLAMLLWKKESRAGTWGDAIAKIEFLSEDARFGSDHQLPRKPGSPLGKGWVQLERGTIHLVFRSGARVEVNGPAALGIDTPLRAYLDFGRVDVYAPETARDFTISTESMEVVDLGTRFQVDVDPRSRESEVSVIEGLVDLHLGSRGAERRIQPLEAGYAARVDASGKMVEITAGPVTHAQPAKDATQLMAHWTFDTLGAEGRIADASTHQWDGLLRAETQPDLVSGVHGQALSFTRDTYVDLSEHLAAISTLNAFTFAAWVRDPEDPLAMLFSLSGDSERHRVQVYLASRFVRFGWQDGLHFDSISGRVDGWTPGQWYHVAVTVAGSVAHLYRDGELIASGSVGSNIGTPISNPSLVNNAAHAYLGRLEDGRQGADSAPQWITGHLDDVQLYAGALSQQAVQFIFKNPGETWTPTTK